MLEAILIALPLVGAVVSTLLTMMKRDQTRVSLGMLACYLGWCLVVATMATRSPGELLVLSPLGAIFLITAGCVLAWQILYARSIAQGRNFVSVGLAFLGGLTAAVVFAHQVPVAGVLLSGTAIIPLYCLRDVARDATDVRAGLGVLVACALAGAGFIAVAPLADTFAATKDVGLVPVAGALLLGSCALLVAGLPFSMWLVRVTRALPPMVTAWYAAFVGGAAMLLLVSSVETFPWLWSEPRLGVVVRIVAAGSAVILAFLAFVERSTLRVAVYSWLSCASITVVGLSTAKVVGVTAVPMATLAMTLSLVIMLAVDGLRHPMDSDGKTQPLPGSLLLVAMLSAAFGFACLPPLAGFSARYLTLEATSDYGVVLFLAVIVSQVLVLAGIVRRMWAESANSRGTTGVWTSIPSVGLVAMVVALVVLGIWPSPIVQVIQASVAQMAGVR